MSKISEIQAYLDELYPDAKCELNYNNGYELLIATVLSAQTTDKRVNMVTKILFQKYKTPGDLKKANIEDIEKIIKPIGTFRKKALYIKEIATVINEQYNDIVPNDINLLIKIKGVGRKTANVVLSNIYKRPAIAVDTHVARVSKRLNLAKATDSVLIIEQKLMGKIAKKNWSKLHHQLVLFGRYHCKAIKPICNDCELKKYCKKNRSLN